MKQATVKTIETELLILLLFAALALFLHKYAYDVAYNYLVFHEQGLGANAIVEKLAIVSRLKTILMYVPYPLYWLIKWAIWTIKTSRKGNIKKRAQPK
jgi:hypothetical protein